MGITDHFLPEVYNNVSKKIEKKITTYDAYELQNSNMVEEYKRQIKTSYE